MKNKELFEKTVGILVNAYLNDTLQPGQPCGCAVGNMIAGNNDYRVHLSDNTWVNYMGNVIFPKWDKVHNLGEIMLPECEYEERERF